MSKSLRTLLITPSDTGSSNYYYEGKGPNCEVAGGKPTPEEALRACLNNIRPETQIVIQTEAHEYTAHYEPQSTVTIRRNYACQPERPIIIDLLALKQESYFPQVRFNYIP